MRIVFFVHRYWPSVGGVERYIEALARALLEAGHEVTVIAGDTDGDVPPEETHQGVRIHRYPATRSPLRCRLVLWGLHDVLTRADVISVSNTHMLEYFWRMMGPSIDPRKVFLIRHGMACEHPVPASDVWRARRASALAVGVVHDGAFIEKWLGVTPDLCPDQGLYPEAGELSAIPLPEPTSAVYVGRLEPDTGIGIYIEAVRRLVRQHQLPFALDVYGDGSQRSSLQSLVTRERLPVLFHGRTANAQQHLVDGYFAFVDGRMAIQEAMARRRPVLATYVNPIRRDYVAAESFSPFLSTVGSADELVERVRHFIDHPAECANMMARAYEYACTLSWHRTAEAYLSFWQERLARPGVRLSRTRRLGLMWQLERESRRAPAAPHGRDNRVPGILDSPIPACPS